MRLVPAFLVVFLLAVLPSLAAAHNVQVPVGIRMDTTHGQVLTDGEGRTLYTVTADEPGVSSCYDGDGCAVAWPPLLVEVSERNLEELTESAALSGPLGLATRRDGSLQVTWRGWPVYTNSVVDREVGDANGHDRTAFGGSWSVVPIE